MRIMHVVHDFLPHHVAGVEVYTDNLIRTLSSDHEVSLVYSEVVPEAPNYSVRRGSHSSATTYEIVNNHRFRGFTETYRNPSIDHVFREILDEVQPEVVHIQHLINLSIGIVDELARRQIPTVMTLHDHWLECANGGQRFHRELGRCAVLDASRCGSCTHHMNGIRLGIRGVLRRHAVDRSQHSGLDLSNLRPRIETTDTAFVYRDQYPVDGRLRPTWVAHPPSRLRFDVRMDSPGTFRTFAALHSDTFEAVGGGVRFTVAVDGQVAEEQILDPKRRVDDRAPALLEVPLSTGRHELELGTEAVPPERNDFCTAGWIGPCVSGGIRSSGAWVGPLRSVMGGAERFVARLSTSAQAGRIKRRWDAMRRTAKRVDLFLAPSRYLGEEMEKFGISREQILHCDYGFAKEHFSCRTDLPEKARKFAYLGSLVVHKGVHVLIEAFNEMPRDASLQIFGSPGYDPAYWARLRRSARHPGIRFSGGLDPASVPKTLVGVDCLMVPSIWCENSPLTIHEAFMAGVPVVGSRLGGNIELLSSGGGLLYEATDASDLLRTMRRLYEEPGLGRRLARTAPRVKPIDEHAAELLRIYRGIRR